MNVSLRPVVIVLSAVLVMSACSGPSVRNEPAPSSDGADFSVENSSRVRPVVGTKGMVVADDRIAAEWGAEILRRGGNAIDAAVATAFAMSVTRPHYAALGGGGFMVFCPKPTSKGASRCRVIDYREMAPAAARRDMYIRAGKGDTDLSQYGALASGVPGVPAGLLHALEKYGTKPRQELMSRAVELAENGFRYTGYMEYATQDTWEHFNPEGKRIFGCASRSKRPCVPGDILRQPDLAKVLREISARGKNGFYSGWVADKIASGLKQSGGVLTAKDLGNYKIRERDPVVGGFRGFEVVSMPPPSAGGVGIVQMLRYVELADADGQLAAGYGAAKSIHAIAHGMSLAFADRAEVFGDPDFVRVPIDRMTDSKYLNQRWSSTFRGASQAIPEEAGIRFGEAGMPPVKVNSVESTETTHFSVVDKEGNAVAVTTTVNGYFGSAFVPPGTGVVMNNEMDDFSIQPGVANMFGLVGAEANAVAARKRPLSSMSPTIVRDAQGNNRVVLGAAGGPTITTSVFQSIVNRFRFGMTLPDAVASGRFHQQWKPAKLRIEKNAFTPEVIAALEGYGWKVESTRALGRIHALERFPDGRVWGVPDRRAEGAAVAE